MQNHLEISSKNKFWTPNMRNWSKSLYGKFTESIRNLPRPPRPVQEGPYGPINGPIRGPIWAPTRTGPRPGLGPNPGPGQIFKYFQAFSIFPGRVGAQSGLGPTWAHMGPYVPIYGPIWAHMSPYGPLWVLLDRSWKIT